MSPVFPILAIPPDTSMALSVKHASRETGKGPKRLRKSRGFGLRTRSGCFTCKARRVKCDETKPACRRCTDFGRQCGGFPDPSTLPLPPDGQNRSFSPQEPSKKAPSKADESSAASRRSSMSSVVSYLELQQFTMPSQPNYFAPGFWPQLVERVSRDQAAVQHALGSLSAAHTAIGRRQGTASTTTAVSSSDDSAHQIALQQYNLAIKELAGIMTTRGTSGTETILVCCFLFVCIEALFGNYESAIGHAEAGLKVYRDWIGNESPDSQVRSEVFSAYNPKFCIWRLGAELEAMLGDLTSEPYTTTDYIQANDNHPWAFTLETAQFSNVEHVASAFVFLKRKLRYLLRANVLFQNSGHAYMTDTMSNQQQELEALYAALEGPYHDFMSAISPEVVDRSVLLLQIRYLFQLTMFSTVSRPASDTAAIERYHDLLDTIEMILREIPYLDESAPSSSSTDGSTYSYNTELKTLMETMRLPNFSLCSELIPSLLYVAKSAPTAQLRQRAIALLWSANAVEGVWNSHTAAKLAEDIFESNRKGLSFAAFPSVDVPLVHYFGDQASKT